jgi:phosphoribosyl-ATP pyrophosphohydrolase
MTASLDRLQAIIRDRRNGDPKASYVAKLTVDGRAKIARKLGEEAIELLVAALADDRAAATSEAADLVFHLLVLLADMGLSFDDVIVELERRDGVSGITEKATRSGEA